MNIKKGSTLFLVLLLMSIFFLSTVHSAQAQGAEQSLLGGLEKQILKVVENIMEARFPFNPNLDQLSERSIILVAAVFTMLFAAIYAIIINIPPFKMFNQDQHHKGASIAFAVGMSALIVYKTPIINTLSAIMGGLAALITLLILVISIVFLIMLLRSGLAVGQRATSELITEQRKAQTVEREQEQKFRKAEAEEVRERQMLAREAVSLNAARAALTTAMGGATDVVAKLRAVNNAIVQLQGARDVGVAAEEKKRINQQLAVCVSMVEKIDADEIGNLKERIAETKNLINALRMGAANDASLLNSLVNAGAEKSLAHNIVNDTNAARAAIQQIEAETKEAMQIGGRTATVIKEAITHLNKGNYPQASLEVQNAINLETNEATHLNEINAHIAQLTNIRNRLTALVNQLAIRTGARTAHEAFVTTTNLGQEANLLATEVNALAQAQNALNIAMLADRQIVERLRAINTSLTHLRRVRPGTHAAAQMSEGIHKALSNVAAEITHGHEALLVPLETDTNEIKKLIVLLKQGKISALNELAGPPPPLAARKKLLQDFIAGINTIIINGNKLINDSTNLINTIRTVEMPRLHKDVQNIIKQLNAGAAGHAQAEQAILDAIHNEEAGIAKLTGLGNELAPIIGEINNLINRLRADAVLPP